MKKARGFSKVAVIVGVVVVALIGVATWLVIDGNSKATNFDNYNFYAVIGGDEHNGGISDHVKTDKDGSYKGTPVYIFEYADFQCSACAARNPILEQIIDELDGKLAIVYRNYLLSYHQNSTAAASAAEAAGLQGYWSEYADALFTNQSEWAYLNGSERTAAFEKYFVNVTDGKGDLEKFREDISSSAVSKKISFDMGIGKRISIEGTPAFYVDGQFIPWADKNGGSVTVNGQTISWDASLSTDEFKEIFKKIVSAKLGE